MACQLLQAYHSILDTLLALLAELKTHQLHSLQRNKNPPPPTKDISWV